MAQETLNGLLQYLLLTLPLEDKLWFIQQMQKDVNGQQEVDEIDSIDNAVEMSLQDVAAGRVYSQEHAKQMRTNMAQRLFTSAAL